MIDLVKFRKATVNDAKNIVDIQKETIQDISFPNVFCHPDYKINLSDTKSFLKYEGYKFLVAQDLDGHVIGYSALDCEDDSRGTASIADIAVRIGYGIAAKPLLEETEKAALKVGFNKVAVTLDKRDSETVKTYERLGYKVEKKEVAEPFATRNRVNLVKKLG